MVGIPTYLIGMLEDLILSKPDWKKIELSGKTPYATERILQRTMILRKDAATTASGLSDNRRNPKTLVKRSSSSSNNDLRNSGFVEDIQKLVIEHATVPILDTVSSILGAKTTTPSPSSISSSSLESSIVGTTTIHTLALRWTELSSSAVQALARGLVVQAPTYTTTISPRQPLQSLLLTGSTFDDDAIPLLAEALQACTLSSLSLTDCHLEDEQVACIITALYEKYHPKLQSLDVSCNFVQSKATAALSQLIKQRSRLINSDTGDSSSTSPPLLDIDISNQDVWDDRNYLHTLFDALTGIDRESSIVRSRIASTSVKSIDLSDNFIQDSHIHSLCEYFSKATYVGTKINLQKLVLRGNSITNDGVKTIAEALPAMQHCVCCLDLRLNRNISEEGVEALTVALHHLHVSKNQKSELSKDRDVEGTTIHHGDIAKKSTAGKSLWHIYLDEPSEAFMMALALHRAGRSRLLLEEERHNSTLPISLWPFIFERSKRCIQPDIDSFDEEISIHGITQADLLYELFSTGQPFFWDNLTT